MTRNKTAIIFGAGPAGLTAAYELIKKTDIKPIIIEKSNEIGGISRTVNYKGNRIDIGGHRFFSKSDVIMNWWQEIMPMESQDASSVSINKNLNPEHNNNLLLVRNRFSRILFLNKLFDYPVALNKNTIFNLGLFRIFKIAYSYLQIKLFPLKEVNTLEDFFISRFGKELYKTFFKNYTEKVWGVPCREIPADWGVQRIKDLSVSKAILHSLKKLFCKANNIEQKNTNTSLIEKFLYPKYGPGQLWERVADMITEQGGEIILNSNVSEIQIHSNSISEISYTDLSTNQTQKIKGDYFFSSIPVKELISITKDNISEKVKTISSGLQYRDFITVGLLIDKLKAKSILNKQSTSTLIPDCWIYIQEENVKIGRLQIFNNWSPYMLHDKNKIWLGLEYFSNEGDELWNMNNNDFISFAINELEKINIIDKKDVLDSTVIKVPKAYPAYFGTYSQFEHIKNYTDTVENLFLVGRNGMHRYNNQDHSMLTAITAVNNVISGNTSKENIWSINVEEIYHEENTSNLK